MGDSEDEFRPLSRQRRREGAGLGGAAGPRGGEDWPSPAAPRALTGGPAGLSLPPRGPKRCGGPAGGKRLRRAADEDLLLAAAVSRSLLEQEGAARSGAEPGGRRPRAENRRRGRLPRAPPALLLQEPEGVRRGIAEQAAALLAEAGAFPGTPPLPASRLRETGGAERSPARSGERRRSLWELSSLSEESRAGAVADPIPSPAGEFGTSQSLPGDEKKLPCPPRETDTLQDLLELAAEGLTLTQWNHDMGQPEHKQMPGGLQNTFVQSLKKQQQQEPQRCFCKTFQLGSLATAFKEMVNNPHLSDVQFQVDSGEVIYAHMFVLYARCPQLLQFVDDKSFVVAEDGDVGARRVLLPDIPAEAVTSFLNYLYTADGSIPQHLLVDVTNLAIRFGVKDLVVPCEGQQSERLSGEEAAGGGKDQAETFEQLLKSMWLDGNEDPVPKLACRGDIIGESMDEQELEVIYETVATQQGRTLGGVKEGGGCTKDRHNVGDREIGLDGDSCPGKVMEGPSTGMARKECKTKWGLESSRWKLCDVNREEDLSKPPAELQQDLKEMVPFSAAPGKNEALPQLSGASGQRNHLDSPGSPLTQFCFTERKCSSPWEPSTDVVRKETASRNFLSCFRGPPEDLQMTFSRDLQAHITFSQTHPLPPSASQPRRRSFQNFKQEQIKRKREASVSNPEEPAGGLSLLPGNVEGGHVIVLDSDEELELRPGKEQEAAASDVSRQRSQETVSPDADVGSCWDPSTAPRNGSEAQDRLGMLVCKEAQPGGKSQELLDLNRQEEDSCREGLAWTEGRTLLVPNTPLSARKSLNGKQATSSRLHFGLENGWTWETQARLLSCSPISPPMFNSPSLLETGQLACNPGAAEGDMAVVVDRQEEQDAGPPSPRGTFAGPLVKVAIDARKPVGSSAQMFEGQEDSHPVTVSSSIAGTEATVCFGVEDSPLQGSQNWAREDCKGKEACPLTQRLPASMPVLRRSDLACQARESPCAPPLMPSPPYSAMATPELKKELRRFGVRALPKRQMVLKLREIFQFTHQARTNSKKRATSVAARSLQKLQPKFVSPCPLLQGSQATKSFAGISGEVNWKPLGSESESGWPKGAAVSADRFPVAGSTEGLTLTASPESAGSSAASSENSLASQSSSAESETSMQAEKDIQASQGAACEVQKLDVLQQYFHSNPSLCQQILLYQPIELSKLHAELKQNGVRIALDKLLDFLDANCITFTTAEARREKQRHFHRAKKKERRRR